GHPSAPRTAVGCLWCSTPTDATHWQPRSTVASDKGHSDKYEVGKRKTNISLIVNLFLLSLPSLTPVMRSREAFPYGAGVSQSLLLQAVRFAHWRVPLLVCVTLSFSKKLSHHIGAIRYFMCDYPLTKCSVLSG